MKGARRAWNLRNLQRLMALAACQAQAIRGLAGPERGRPDMAVMDRRRAGWSGARGLQLQCLREAVGSSIARAQRLEAESFLDELQDGHRFIFGMVDAPAFAER